MDSDEPQPQREALRFELSAGNVTPDLAEVRIAIKQAAERLLYHWRTFPIVLPSSITDVGDVEGSDQNLEPVISFKDLFIAPSFDEVEQVALDSKGKSKRLNEKQLHSIRRTGEFEVESLNFTGQVHVWRLNQLLQIGTERASENLLNDVARAVSMVLVHARNRFHSAVFSVSEGLNSVLTACTQLLDILIGMPSTRTQNLEVKLEEERSRFLVAELHVRADARHDWKNFCDYIKDKCSQFELEKTKTLYMHPPPVPYCFLTPRGNEIDLRLFNRDLMNRSMILLKKILEEESKGWHVKHKDRLITELKGRDMSYAEIKDYVNKSIQEKYIEKVFNAILINQDIEALQPGLGLLLVQQARCALCIMKSMSEMRSKLSVHQEQHKALLLRAHPVLSRITSWLDDRLTEFYNDYVTQHRWSAHEAAIQDCRAEGLEQFVYFLHRDLIFMRDRESVLKKELSKVREPNRTFQFRARIWSPKNWIIKRHQYGDEEVIPTLIGRSAPTRLASYVPGPEEATYSVDKYTVRKTSTRRPFWRWVNYCHRTWTWMWNAMFCLGVVIPWCSPFSMRALLLPQPFTPNLQLDRSNGTLVPDSASRTHTLWSRLSALWRHIRRARREFETNPGTGFLGKSFTRHINRLWNYVLKGVLGSSVLVCVYVPACITLSSLSFIAAVFTPLWMPIVTLCVHAAAVLFYDFDHPVLQCRRVTYLCETLLYRLCICGVIQPLAALISAIFILPLTSALLLTGACIRRSFRWLWDMLMYNAVIKKRGRVPCRDGFAVRRIHGPGLASHFFYQIKPEQALAAAEARMESHELNVWRDGQVRLIEQPKEDFRKFVEKCFGSFSAGLQETGVYRQLLKETRELVQALFNEVDLRKERLFTGLTPDIQSKIRLTSRELKVVITQTGKLLEGFYPDHVLRHLPISIDQFWEDRHLEPDDWQGLATQLLTEVFSSSFLTPLEEMDNCFKLQVEHLNLTRYAEMLKSSEFRDDLDVVSTVHTPKGDIDVDSPYLDAQIFSPRKMTPSYVDMSLNASRRIRWQFTRPWRQRGKESFATLDQLHSPLNIAHPVIISVIIHNRDVDDEPFNLDDSVCRQILRAGEGLQYVEPRGGVGGGRGDEMNGGSSSVGTSLEPYFDRDTSTPDRTTNNSDPDVVLVVHPARVDQEQDLYRGGEVGGVSASRASTARRPVLGTLEGGRRVIDLTQYWSADNNEAEDIRTEQEGSRTQAECMRTQAVCLRTEPGYVCTEPGYTCTEPGYTCTEAPRVDMSSILLEDIDDYDPSGALLAGEPQHKDSRLNDESIERTT